MSCSVRRKVRYEHGDGQLRQLKLAELALAHEPHRDHEREIYDERSDNNYSQAITPRIYFYLYWRLL